MLFCYIFLGISMMTFLRDFHVSSCEESCTDKPVFTPSRLVVRFGDPTFASCSVCQHDCINNLYKLESPVGLTTTNGTTISWTVNRLTKWDASPICYYSIKKTNYQCCTTLPVTVYQPPDNVSISFVDPTGPMFEGQQCTLQCTVEDVAPVENLAVTFYRGRTVLDHQYSQSQFNYPQMYPVTDIFSLNITLSKEDDGVQYWCEAKLELGPDGPQPPPVVTSQNITTTVYYTPQIKRSSHPDPITITEGNPLQLSCSAVGNPGPSYAWTPPPESTSSSNSSNIMIIAATLADEGKYTCSASNSVGTDTVEFSVDVQELSATNYTGLIIGLIVGAVVVILGLLGYSYCYKHNRMGEYNLKDVFRPHKWHAAVPTVELYMRNPSPSYTWTLPPQSTSKSNSSILTINSATFADEGKYTCSVSNGIGNVTTEFDVVVRLELTSTRLPLTPTKKRTGPTCSTSSSQVHRFIMCFMLLFSALV